MTSSDGPVGPGELAPASTSRKVREVDVAIIGNGPAGICLSLLLSGHMPYFTGSHPNPYLTSKLNENPHWSLLDHDLDYLSDGLEGRSINPVALLLDALLQPNTDLGESHPPSLRWELSSSRRVSHVVLGSGQPGGSWQLMHPDVKTLSLGSWLELPVYSFSDWQKDRLSPLQTVISDGDGQESTERPSRKRTTLGEVAQYYRDYVDRMGIGDNFLNGVTVTCTCHTEPEMQRVRTCSCSSDSSTCSMEAAEPGFQQHTGQIQSAVEQETSDSRILECLSLFNGGLAAPPTTHQAAPDVAELPVMCVHYSNSVSPSLSRETSPTTSCTSDSDDNGVFGCCRKRNRYKWFLRAKETNNASSENEGVIVCAKNLVLACGVGGSPRKLGVPGEDLPFVRHTFQELPSQLESFEHHEDRSLLVVGAGLSAADAIILALSRGVRVVHVFYKDATSSTQAYHHLSPDDFPEYRYVFDLMRGRTFSSRYEPLAKYHVTEFRPGGVCVVQNEQGLETTVEVSAVQVLIGSEAKLDFLPSSIVDKLGVYSDKPIDAKKNPVDIDPYTYECANVPSLFAVGPLAGDNFVRFAIGGSVGVSHCLSQRL